jgi:outer membrane protein OmpA-like peptidoglycan-associated protein
MILRVPALLLLVLAASPELLPAQLGRVIRRAADRAEANVNREIDKAVDNAVDCALGDTRCVEQAQRDGKKVQIKDAQGNVITDASGNPVQTQTEASSVLATPGTGVWRNYDFVPGDSVWYASDWSTERVGRFPARQLEFVRGNFEIVELNGRRMLEAHTAGMFKVNLPAALPRQFTLEFDLQIGYLYNGVDVVFAPGARNAQESEGHRLGLHHAPGIWMKNQQVSATVSKAHIGSVSPVRLQVDDEYAIVYLGSERVAQVPVTQFARNAVLEFHVDANERNPVYISDIVVRAGLDPLYDGLMAKGEVTTHGILFDVGSDRLRPESSPKLEEFRAMLAQHADLRVMIEGHTDATGDDASNLALSDRRAQAVVAWLTSNGIAANRLQASGKGETVPVGDNATEAGRQQNRRVVIRKI